MKPNVTMIAVLMVIIMIILGGLTYLYLQLSPKAATKVAVRCQNENGVISFLINEEEKTLTMEGQPVDAKNIKLFNETAVSAEWLRADGGTRIFLDRIAGRLELDAKSDDSDWETEEFSCSRSGIRF